MHQKPHYHPLPIALIHLTTQDGPTTANRRSGTTPTPPLRLDPFLKTMDLLCAIVDVAPDAWDAVESVCDRFSFDDFITSFALFLKAHVMMHWTNAVSVLAHNGSERFVTLGFVISLSVVPHSATTAGTYFRVRTTVVSTNSVPSPV
jgi:hypothetical protein